jgi:tetratricopeptide (TPR) repeat protein
MSKRVLFRLCAIFIGLIPFLMLEGALRIFEVGGHPDSADPLAGFNRNFPLFERHGAVYRTAHSREPFFPAQEFPATKPPNGFRIFCLGGSTVHGHPYQSPTAFPAWLQIELTGADPSRVYQAINCGGVSYASYRLRPIVQEILDYQPDLIIIATGENEFLEDRTYQSLKARPALWARAQDAAYSLRIVTVARDWLRSVRPKTGGDQENGKLPLLREVKTRLDDRSGYASYHRDDAWHERVRMQFEETMRGMVKLCRNARVPVMLLKLGSNLRDCPPFKSEHKAGLLVADEALWEADFEAATAAEKTNLNEALALYLKAEALDGEYALLAFRIARVLDRLGRKSEALQYYVKAKDQDICPLRLVKAHEQVLSAIAAETKIPLVDVAELIASKSPDHIPGNDWYLDHVHPTIGGHQRIAQGIVAQLLTAGIVSQREPWPEPERRAAYGRQLARLGPAYFSDGRRRVDWLEGWTRRERLFDETLPQDVSGYLRLGFKRLDLDNEEGAWQAFGQASKRDPGAAETLRHHAEELLAQGRTELAQKLLQRLEHLQSSRRAAAPF